MKQILVMMAVVSLSVMADEVVITDSVLKEVLGKKLKKPYGKFAPPMKLTEAELQSLTDLTLAETKITDANLKEVVKLQNLTYLNLYDTQITDAGLKEVAKLQKLTKLYLNSTQITDAVLKEVAKLQKLDDPEHTVREAAFSVAPMRKGFLLREDEWAFIQYGETGKSGMELYNMKDDPRQYTNLVKDPTHQKTVTRFKAQMVDKLLEVRTNDLNTK